MRKYDDDLSLFSKNIARILNICVFHSVGQLTPVIVTYVVLHIRLFYLYFDMVVCKLSKAKLVMRVTDF